MRRVLAEFRRGAAADGPILAGVFVVWICLLAVLTTKDVSGLQTLSYFANFVLYLCALVFFLAFLIGRTLWRARPDRPIGYLRAVCVEKRIAAQFMRGLPMLLALAVFMPAFSAMKSAISLFHPYTWDHVWIAADLAVHGTDPWRILQPVLGYPIVTAFIAACYHVWVLLIYAGSVYFCFFNKNATLRAQYFIGYFAIWTVIGVILATALASVGPCFVGPLLGNHHYDQQMAYLRSANAHFPIMVLSVQDALLASYQASNHGLGRGITAMPSIHVAMATLFFLAMRRVSRKAGWLFGAFAVIVAVGSVHLAYHYAVDGYVSIAVTSLIWIAAGALARRMMERPRLQLASGASRPRTRSANRPAASQIITTPTPPTTPSEA
jgi:hypothetical protein